MKAKICTKIGFHAIFCQVFILSWPAKGDRHLSIIVTKTECNTALLVRLLLPWLEGRNHSFSVRGLAQEIQLVDLKTFHQCWNRLSGSFSIKTQVILKSIYFLVQSDSIWEAAYPSPTMKLTLKVLMAFIITRMMCFNAAKQKGFHQGLGCFMLQWKNGASGCTGAMWKCCSGHPSWALVMTGFFNRTILQFTMPVWQRTPSRTITILFGTIICGPLISVENIWEWVAS